MALYYDITYIFWQSSIGLHFYSSILFIYYAFRLYIPGQAMKLLSRVTGFWVVPWVVWTDEPPEILVNQPEEVAWVMSVEASRFASLGLNLVSNIKHPKLKVRICYT